MAGTATARATAVTANPPGAANTRRALNSTIPVSSRKDEVMTNVAEPNGTVNFDQTLTDTCAIWREAVNEIAANAQRALPGCYGRIEKAVALVLNGDVDMLADGTAHVA